ncbi:MAG TPA: DUF4062 domain-containing protein [Nitrosomonas nitrosa]|nr:DUF4062 domain-containing protein [Nitrosomonas nitrosa]
MRVYLSSTFQDLKEYRKVARDILLKTQYLVISMEDYVATDERPLAKCLKDVAACDLYVGIIGNRYGFIPEDEDNKGHYSITELEYREAQKFNRPSLLFLLSETAESESTLKQSDAGEAKLWTFKKVIGLNHVVSFVDSPSDLAQKLSASLYNWQIQKELLPSVPNLNDVIDNKFVKILNYVPGERLIVRWYPHVLSWIVGGSLSAVFANGIFLGLISSLSDGGVQSIGHVVLLISGGLLALGSLWLGFWPPYISFNLRTSYIKAKVPGYFAWMPIQSRQLGLKMRQRSKGRWSCQLYYANMRIAETDPFENKELARKELESLALAINHAMGLRFLGN